MVLPDFDQNYLRDKGLNYLEAESNNHKGIIIKNWILPKDKYNVNCSDLLIIIPPGYPDVAPDMWYFNPELTLLPDRRFAKATNHTIEFNGINWQRWSRHLSADKWRSGIDGIHTYLKRIIESLEKAI